MPIPSCPVRTGAKIRTKLRFGKTGSVKKDLKIRKAFLGKPRESGVPGVSGLVDGENNLATLPGNETCNVDRIEINLNSDVLIRAADVQQEVTPLGTDGSHYVT